ncbi:glutamate racemase [Noviherbaspirillum autotrophicum]|uniref:Glutamate racemase n=1 Tax=Noviherbaspirillum autotrophicum TaxID=709839 RepID=A0A0C2BTP3_9BURK|nr:glutamate racemase [Noviherbaspirillum autotrophicum]KIF81386.1 glutamate racemase [Noviherbaspirillum autotrophicum]
MVAIQSHSQPASDAPIGVFDSGIGGLSVLKYIRASLPCEQLLYFADSGYAPYGGRSESEIVARSLAIAEFLMQYRMKALVVACNTATAAAIKALRERYSALPVVGVEPGLKPAAALSKSGTVGVLATERTLASAKFNLLREQISAATNVRFLPQPCKGLADQVEKGELHSAATAALLQRYVAPLLEQGADTLVLGCTHYPFVLPLLEEIVGRATSRSVAIVDTGEPVARQLARRLAERGLLRTEGNGTVQGFTTGSETALSSAFAKLLNLHPPVAKVAASD